MPETISIPTILSAIKNTEAHINQMLTQNPVPLKELDFEYDYLATMQTSLKIAEKKAAKKSRKKNLILI
jgi:hypothetical protein